MITLDTVTTNFPERTLTVAERCEELGWTPTQAHLFRRIGGLAELRIEPSWDLVDLVLPAARAAIAGVPKDDIRYVIYGHAIHGSRASDPHFAERIVAELELTSAQSFALSQQNCAIPLSALDVARALLSADDHPRARALIVTGEKLPIGVAAQINTVLVGDGAAAALVSRDGTGDEILRFATKTEGQFYDGLRGTNADFRAAAAMRPPVMRAVMHEALSTAGFEMSDVQAIIPPNQGRAFWDDIFDSDEVRDKCFFENNARFGHCLASDVFINYATMRDEGRLVPDRPVLWIATGLGWTLSALVVVPRGDTARPSVGKVA